MNLNPGSYRNLIKRNLASLFSFIHLGFIQGSNVLIQLLLIPLVSRILGLASFGHVMVAASYAALLSLLVNYGSNQSGVKDVALHKQNPKALSEIFYTIFFVRIFLFALSLLSVWIMYVFHFSYAKYFLLANAIILSEVFNPFFFFVGMQTLLWYNISNLIAKICSAALIIFFIRSPAQSPWVNFLLGITNTIAYGILCLFTIKKYQLVQYKVPIKVLYRYICQNFYLTGNNLSVQLQQSFFLFTVSGTGDALLLGAYSLCDKIVWSFRILIISFSNAVYPKAVLLHETGDAVWRVFKKKINLLLFVLFLAAAILLFTTSSWIVILITGESNQLAAAYIKAISLVPLIAALNSMNVIDLLMKDQYRSIFTIALMLLGIAVITSEIFVIAGNRLAFGYYPMIVEIFSLPLYFFYIRKARRNGGI